MWDSPNSGNCRTCQYSSTSKMACDSVEGPYLDKENMQPFNHMKNDELSLYDNGNVEPYHPSSLSRCRRPLEEHDSNSLDSGYGASYYGEKFLSYASPTRTTTASFSSMCSMEDEFLDFSDVEPLEKPSLPQDFKKLISNPLVLKTKPQKICSPKDTIIRPLFRRALSLQPQSDNTPNSSRVRTSLFKGDQEMRSFKRPDPPNNTTVIGVKRSRIFDDDDDSDASVPMARPSLQRAFSVTEESIMCAVQRSAVEPDLIGDFSRSFSLPLTTSRHQDLKAITPQTLAALIRGEFSNTVTSYKVIDCRYPYEFEGGHVTEAINIYTKAQCLELLDSRPPVTENSRHILVFHCEFSSERGPNLYRFLRKEDRNRNEIMYPYLHYPEIYLLEGGYKKFFEEFSEMCTPVAYKEMLHPDHEGDLRHFRSKSKTWNCDSRQRPGKKRLGM
ncbi:M-phase inducer phosphatase-like [Diorhabda carinulata]|uniref:M-phase inducer phosphatase-like n=1 Tax=Diorhabda carinulata TaxID=1163345 RepID=UPI0025A03EF7|nr:M-phase inducer phosphatase-like [Diorhabda carinulata]